MKAGGSLAAGKVIGQLLAPGASNIPAVVNAGHTMTQSARLYDIANQIPAGLDDLKAAVEMCAHVKNAKSGGQLMATVASVGATAAAGAVIVATGGAALVPVAAVAAVAGASGAGAGFGVQRGIRGITDWSSEINRLKITTVLIEAAVDADPVKQRWAREALGVLGFPIDSLNAIRDERDIDQTARALKRLL
jgi:hypothetical protein